MFEVELQLDTPEQRGTRYPTQHITAPSDQHSTIFPSDRSLEGLQHIDVSMLREGKPTTRLSQEETFRYYL